MSTVPLTLVRRALPEIARLWALPFPELKKLRAKHNPHLPNAGRHLSKAQCVSDILFREELETMAPQPDYPAMLREKDALLQASIIAERKARTDAEVQEKLYQKERTAKQSAEDRNEALLSTMRQLMRL